MTAHLPLLQDAEVSQAEEVVQKAEGEEEVWRNALKLIRMGDGVEVLVKHGLELRRTDLRSLQGTNWLNDKVVDEYLRLVAAKADVAESDRSVTAVTTFLYKKLEKEGVEEGYKDTENWIKDDLRNQDMVLLPIHARDHWSLIAVLPKRREIQYFDSLRGSRHSSQAPIS